jgi:hypothetical protein
MIFEDLDAWKSARDLVRLVYQLTRETELSMDFGLREVLFFHVG